MYRALTSTRVESGAELTLLGLLRLLRGSKGSSGLGVAWSREPRRLRRRSELSGGTWVLKRRIGNLGATRSTASKQKVSVSVKSKQDLPLTACPLERPVL